MIINRDTSDQGNPQIQTFTDHGKADGRKYYLTYGTCIWIW